MADLPLGLVAELTYRCPLHCAYCSNPVELAPYRDELTTADWTRVLQEARDLGVLQVHLSGGEPLVRRDLVTIARCARGLDMYVNLVTSGVGLTERRLADLRAAGVEHVQLSIQDADLQRSDAIAGTRSFDRKLRVAALVRRYGLPLTVNVVLHRANVEHVGAVADLAAELGAERLELAHTQYYGWGFLNRAGLLPTRQQVDQARTAVADARRRHGDRMRIVYVLPDMYEARPKPCMYGWGRRHVVVAPNGDVLPCTAAATIPDLPLENVRASPLAAIWHESESFNRFRGTAWMPSPCRDCAFREVDFGGCRCQAQLLLGDAAATDPVCVLSPHHGVVERIVRAAQEQTTVAPVRRPSR